MNNTETVTTTVMKKSSDSLVVISRSFVMVCSPGFHAIVKPHDMLHQDRERATIHIVELPLPERSQLEEEYRRLRPRYEKALATLQMRLREELEAAGIEPTVKWRVKSFDSCFGKLVRRVREAGEAEQRMELTDLLGIRLVCPFLEDIGRIELALRERYEVLEVERKGSKYAFHEFGYDSTHYLIRVPREITSSFDLPGDLACELQLRTILQDAWAEVEHELIYKAEFSPLDDPLRRKLAALNANLSLSDTIFQEIRDYQRELQRELEKRRSDFWRQYHQVSGDGEPAAGRPASHEMPEAVSEQGNGGRGEHAEQPETLRQGRETAETLDNLLLQALLEHNHRNYEGAIEIYNRLLEHELRPVVESVIYAHRGMAFFGQRRHDHAIEDFSRALRLNPDNAKALYYRGVVYRVTGRSNEALRDLDECLRRDPYHFDGAFARAQLYYELGDYARALRDCDRALEIMPESGEARKFRSLLTDRIY